MLDVIVTRQGSTSDVFAYAENQVRWTDFLKRMNYRAWVQPMGDARNFLNSEDPLLFIFELEHGLVYRNVQEAENGMRYLASVASIAEKKGIPVLALAGANDLNHALINTYVGMLATHVVEQLASRDDATIKNYWSELESSVLRLADMRASPKARPSIKVMGHTQAFHARVQELTRQSYARTTLHLEPNREYLVKEFRLRYVRTGWQMSIDEFLEFTPLTRRELGKLACRLILLRKDLENARTDGCTQFELNVK
ncbi:hypothetical protein HY493_04995 [Candidatus Woesearchaeota archaeon]|nr:hypothetical protein [Candidatus Woesearchaeota archaeon]